MMENFWIDLKIGADVAKKWYKKFCDTYLYYITKYSFNMFMIYKLQDRVLLAEFTKCRKCKWFNFYSLSMEILECLFQLLYFTLFFEELQIMRLLSNFFIQLMPSLIINLFLTVFLYPSYLKALIYCKKVDPN